MLNAIDAIFYRPPPHVNSPSSLRRLYVAHHMPHHDMFVSDLTSVPCFEAVRASSGSLSDAAAYAYAEATLDAYASSKPSHLLLVSGNYFQLLGVNPALGRLLGADDDRAPGDARVAVLSYDLWRSVYGKDSAVAGRALRIGAIDYTIVGVTPQGFAGLDLDHRADIWIPLRASLENFKGPSQLRQPGSALVYLVARFKPFVSSERAAAEAGAALRTTLQAGSSDSVTAIWGALQRERGPMGSAAGRLVGWLTILSIAVLILSCSNATFLLSAKAFSRFNDMAIRHALGATRAQIVGQILLESILLAAIAAAIAIPATLLTERVLAGLLFGTERLPVSLSVVRTAGIALGVASLTGLATGLLPAIQIGRTALVTPLKTAVAQSKLLSRHIRAGLIAGEVTCALVLLYSAFLLWISVSKARRVELGMDPESVLIAVPNLQEAGYSPTSADALIGQVLRRLDQQPGVLDQSAALTAPFMSSMAVGYSVPGSPDRPAGVPGIPLVNAVTPQFFSTLGIRLRKGRLFTEEDREGSQAVAIVNETMARFYWPGKEAIGHCINLWSATQPCLFVIGVVSDAHSLSLSEVPPPQFYLPLAQNALPFPGRVILVRTGGDPAQTESALRSALLSAVPGVRVNITRLSDLTGRDVRPFTRGASFSGAFAAAALLLSILGVYSVASFSMRTRVPEFAIRSALGASFGALMLTTIKDVIRPAVWGTLIGAALVAFLSSLLRSLLFGIAPLQPLVLIVTAFALTIVSVAASLIPTGRIVTLDFRSALQAP